MRRPYQALAAVVIIFPHFGQLDILIEVAAGVAHHNYVSALVAGKHAGIIARVVIGQINLPRNVIVNLIVDILILYLQEGVWVIAEQAVGEIQETVLEAPVQMCDASHNLIVNLTVF